MSNDQVRQFVEESSQALQSGSLDRAVELADQALALDPTQGDAHLIKAIALSQLGQSDRATEAFRLGIAASPQNAKIYYNFAVHLYSAGARAESTEMCREALRLDPSNGAARDLLSRMESVATSPAPSSGSVTRTPYPMAGMSPSMGSVPPVHSLKFVEDLGSKWLLIGWVIALLNLGASAFSWIQSASMFPAIMDALSSGNQAAMEQLESQQNPMMQLIGYVLFAAVLAWSIMDIMDRRNNWWWLVVVIGCCVCMPITFPIYLLAGRKT